jgi:hypothetical protein
MTAPDLCRLASAAFPGLAFEPVDVGRGPIAMASQLSVRERQDEPGFHVTVRGCRISYTDYGDTIHESHANAVALHAEYEPDAAATPPNSAA